MKVAVVGATGLVGTRMLEVLAERNFPVTELYPVASEKSVGRKITFKGKEWTVVSADDAIAARPDVALFSAGAGASRELAPKFAEAGCRVVDNSSCWRMDPSKKLVVPEINGDVLGEDDYIIANPNCSTIQAVVALKPLYDTFGIKRIVYSTYQAVSGAGVAGYNDLKNGVAGEAPKKFPYPIAFNMLPHIDVFLDNGYTKEEWKMIEETKKILHDQSLRITATTVRVPVFHGHSESINVEFKKPCTKEEVFDCLSHFPGLVLMDDVKNNVYPMPILAEDHDEVFVGRVRIDESVESGVNIWCVADNIRKGAATNAVQIVQLLINNALEA